MKWVIAFGLLLVPMYSHSEESKVRWLYSVIKRHEKNKNEFLVEEQPFGAEAKSIEHDSVSCSFEEVDSSQEQDVLRFMRCSKEGAASVATGTNCGPKTKRNIAFLDMDLDGKQSLMVVLHCRF